MAGQSSDALVARVRDSVIGDDHEVPGPYGPRRILYADHTASGRALTLVEDTIHEQILPWYANTHTESSGTGRRTTHLREQARQLVHEAVGGTAEHVVIFTGSGSTGAIDKFVRILGLGTGVPSSQRPVVFVGPYEHHSNELLWRESAADVVRIPEDSTGAIALDRLDQELARYADRPLRIGSFSAASNVTGRITDVAAISAVLHRYGALSCWDYASAGPHLAIDMAGDGLDAVFLSPHKFPGGPGTPGVLAVRRDLVRNAVPTVPGGGTISYVHPGDRHYVTDPVHREEGGTPAIVESIRAGLVLGLHRAVGVDAIRSREERLVTEAIASWRTNAAIEILGDLSAPRLPIVSFVVRTPAHGRLHHNFVVAVLNDLFGIQSRGGCSCAGPYGHHLLGIDPVRARAYASQALDGWLGIKPGWTRVSFSYYLSEAEFEYLVTAVHLTATHGHRLLPCYRFDPATGLWRHRDAPPDPLVSLRFEPSGRPAGTGVLHRRVPERVLPEYLRRARAIFAAHPARRDDHDGPVLEAFDALRWFDLPSACLSAPAGRG